MDYIEGISEAIQDTEFIKLTFVAFGVLIALVLLILSMKIIKQYVTKHVRGIKSFSMTFDDLEKMRASGMITDAELARIKSGLVRAFSKSIVSEQPKGEKAIQDLTDIPIASIPSRRVAMPSPSIPAALSDDSETPRPKTLDIDDLLRKGIITKEEHEALLKTSRKKAQDL